MKKFYFFFVLQVDFLRLYSNEHMEGLSDDESEDDEDEDEEDDDEINESFQVLSSENSIHISVFRSFDFTP